MKKKKLGNTGIEVTPIGFGVLTVGNTQLNLPVEEGANVLRYALEKGINFLDTAQYYETYPYIRQALKDSPYKPVICSKSLDLTYSQMEFAVGERLWKRWIWRISISFCFTKSEQDPDWDDRAGAWRCLVEAKEKGLVKAIGVSTHHVDVAEKMAAIPDVARPLPSHQFQKPGYSKGRRSGNERRDGRSH